MMNRTDVLDSREGLMAAGRSRAHQGSWGGVKVCRPVGLDTLAEELIARLQRAA